MLAPTLILIAGAILLLLLGRGRAAGERESSADDWTFAAAPRPFEPCWTDELGRADGMRYGRGQCFNATLASADRRTARGEYPVPAGD